MLPNASEFLAINANLLKIAFGRAFAREIRYMGEQYNINLSDQDTLIQIITDCTAVVDPKIVGEVIAPGRRLCYALYIERYKRLPIIPRKVSVDFNCKSV